LARVVAGWIEGVSGSGHRARCARRKGILLSEGRRDVDLLEPPVRRRLSFAPCAKSHKEWHRNSDASKRLFREFGNGFLFNFNAFMRQSTIDQVDCHSPSKSGVLRVATGAHGQTIAANLAIRLSDWTCPAVRWGAANSCKARRSSTVEGRIRPVMFFARMQSTAAARASTAFCHWA